MTDDPDSAWNDDMDSADRVRAVAETLTRPRSASWVATQAAVNYKTAQKYLGKLVSDGRLRTTESDRTTYYAPNPRQQFFEEIGDLIDSHSKAELTQELQGMSARIESWQSEYGVDSPDELRVTLDETLSTAERREREGVIDSWEYTREMRTIVRHAIRLYDDLTRLTVDSPTSRIEAVGSK